MIVFSIAIINYDRQHRRIFHQSFQPQVVQGYYPVIRRAAVDLAINLAASPEDFVSHIRQYALSLVSFLL